MEETFRARFCHFVTHQCDIYKDVHSFITHLSHTKSTKASVIMSFEIRSPVTSATSSETSSTDTTAVEIFNLKSPPHETPPSPQKPPPPEVLFQTLQLYIADFPCSPLKRQRLAGLVSRTQKSFASILNGPESQASPPIPSRVECTPSNRQDLLTLFTRELKNVITLDGSGKPTEKEYKLLREWIFQASLFPKAPVKQPVHIAVGCKQTVEVVMMKSFPGRQFAVDVGYCVHFDSEVFFGVKGSVFLVDMEQILKDDTAPGELKVFEADDKLEGDWRKFALQRVDYD